MQPLSSVGRVMPRLLAVLLGALDQTVMAPALPAVAEALGGLDQMPGAVTSYQKAVAYGDLGTATSSVAFLRQIGASTGVAVAGVLITTMFTDQVPAAVALSQMMPIVFGLMSPLLALAFVLAVLLAA